MPKSRVRKKKTGSTYVAPLAVEPTRRRKQRRWVGPAVLGLLFLGMIWLLLAYLTQASIWPQSKLGDWNVLIGFGFIAGGFGLATQWR